MNKAVRLSAAAALALTSVSVNAWWGGPWTSWAEDVLRDGWFDFDLSIRGSIRTWPRRYDYNAFYGAPYSGLPYGMHVPATDPTSRQTTGEDRQRELAEQRSRSLEEAVAVQRRLIEGLAAQSLAPANETERVGCGPGPVGDDPLAESERQDGC